MRMRSGFMADFVLRMRAAKAVARLRSSGCRVSAARVFLCGFFVSRVTEPAGGCWCRSRAVISLELGRQQTLEPSGSGCGRPAMKPAGRRRGGRGCEASAWRAAWALPPGGSPSSGLARSAGVTADRPHALCPAGCSRGRSARSGHRHAGGREGGVWRPHRPGPVPVGSAFWKVSRGSRFRGVCEAVSS